MSYGLRQQLSSESLEVLERAADAELERLNRLHWEVVAVTSDAAAFARIERQAAAVRSAKAQLRYVFLDQFPQGRVENDAAGRSGMVSQNKSAG